VPIVATAIVVDAIAVANGEAVPGAIPPDRVLHEPGKRRREGRIELPSIDVRREQAENAGAPSRPVALVSVRMVGAQPLQDPGSVQEIMDQGVDRHEGCADFDPQRPSLAGAQQQRRQANKLSGQVRAAEGRIRELEAQVRHHQDKADRAEKWLQAPPRPPFHQSSDCAKRAQAAQ
jgi:hypothetical protein